MPAKRISRHVFQQCVQLLPLGARDRLMHVMARARYGTGGNGNAEFSLEEVLAWLVALRTAGVTFEFPDALPDGTHQRPPVAVLKHDIHNNLDRAVAMAVAEHERGIHGLYFMMGPHHLNSAYFGSSRSWSQLRYIQSLGHRLGLHLDVLDAIRRSGDLYKEVESILSRFAAEGLDIRYGNSHGNSMLKKDGAPRHDFLIETSCETSSLPAESALTAQLVGHVRQYSLKQISARFGLRYWVDRIVYRDGVRMALATYVTDNSGAIRILNRGIASQRFTIDPAFTEASVAFLVRAPSVILLHPQYYRPAVFRSWKVPA